MRRPALVWGFIRQRLAVGDTVLLLTVVDAGTGSPGRAGFVMAVAGDGTTAGTIGGGPMEQRLVRECAGALRSGRPVRAVRMLRHAVEPGPGEEASGLVCGGWQRIAVHRLEPSDLRLAERVWDAVVQRRPLTLHLAPGRITVSEGVTPSDAGYATRVSPGRLALVVGGGHVGRALAHVLATLDLDVVLTDSQPQDADEGFRADVRPISAVGALVDDPGDSFAVVVCATVGHSAQALAALLPLGLRYLGLLGTAEKRGEVLRLLPTELREAFDAQHVRSPAGLPIGSHTPEEIAVSIAAEIIAIGNR